MLINIDSIRKFFSQFLLIKEFNTFAFKLRFIWFIYIKNALNSSKNSDNVLVASYSKQMLLRGKTSHRPLRYIRPLSVIDILKKDTSRILSIGCRYETELLYLIGHGFKKENVRGLDMLSYSPWVDVGNMHNLSYSDSEWDAVLLGWVISYSDNPKLACSEVIRVCKNGGLIAVGVAYYPKNTNLTPAGNDRKILENRVQTVEDILGLFAGHVDKVYFAHDTVDEFNEGNCVAIFSIKK